MSNRRVRRIEEMGNAQRVSEYWLDDTDALVQPDGLTVDQVAEWDRVIAVLQTEGLEHIVDGVRLSDHCRNF